MSIPSVNSFKSLLRSQYRSDVRKTTTAYKRCREKISRFRNHVVFSARCKKEGIVPSSLRIRAPIDTQRGRQIARRAEQQFLDERLRLANYRVKQLEEERKWREIGIKRTLREPDMNRLMEVSEANAELVFMATRDKQREKFAEMQADKKKLAEQIRPECGTSKK